MRWRAAAFATATLGAAGLAARLVSSDDPGGAGGPLPACPREGLSRNCYRAGCAFAAPPEAVFAAAERAVRAHRSVRTGRALSIRPYGLALDADFKVGPFFVDDVRLAVEAAAGGSVLFVRSAARVPGLDMGVNRTRVEALLDAVQNALG